MKARLVRHPAMLGIVLAAGFILPAVRSGQLQAQADTCGWQPLSQSESSDYTYHAAAIVDPGGDRIVLIGGVNERRLVDHHIVALDLSGPDVAQVSLSIDNNPRGSLSDRFGAVAAFRPAAWPGDDDSMLVVGGAAASGVGTNVIQQTELKEGYWKERFLPLGDPFEGRVFAAGAFAPVHDVLIVHGGTGKCIPDLSFNNNSSDCWASNMGTRALVMEQQSRSPRWYAVAASSPDPGMLYGHTMVYDQIADRMLMFGGTFDGRLARDTQVWELPLRDVTPDGFGRLAWKPLTVMGPVPAARFFHSAAFDPSENRLVIFGGHAGSFPRGQEKVLSDTWALELGGGSTPRWHILSDSDPGPGGSVGSMLLYSSRHRSVILSGGRGLYREARGDDQVISTLAHRLQCSEPTPTASATEPPIATATQSPTMTIESPTSTITSSPTITPSSTNTPTATQTPTATDIPLPIFLPVVMHDPECPPVDYFSDVVLVIDASTSMLSYTGSRRRKIDAAVEGARAFIHGQLRLQPGGDQVAIVTFNELATLRQGLTSNVGLLDAALNDIEVRSQSRIELAVSAAALELLGRRGGQGRTRAMVLLSDGEANPVPAEQAVAAATAAKDAGILVYVIGLGNLTEKGEWALRQMASDDERYLTEIDADRLRLVYEDLVIRVLCPREIYWGRRR